MPNILVHRDQQFVAVSIVSKRPNGTLVTPDSNPRCEIFRVNPETGGLAKDLALGTLGEFNLSLAPGSSFLYTAGLDLTAAQFSQYELTVTFSFDASAGTQVEHLSLSISDPLTVTYRNRNVMAGALGTTFKAPTPVL